ncbi:MAG TPA: DUF2917 domain-containing protein [Anaeromyxobacteraceae bacterium]
MSWWRFDPVDAMRERQLGLDATLRLVPGRHGMVLGVREGCALVTQEGDAVDHVLVAGEELRIRGRGVVVAWALAPSRIAVGEVTASEGRLSRGVAPAQA